MLCIIQDITQLFSGQLSAVLCTVEAIVPVVCNPVYSAVYGNTIKSFPGAAFLVTVFVMLICIVAFM
jgi:hypothetical protein